MILKMTKAIFKYLEIIPKHVKSNFDNHFLNQVFLIKSFNIKFIFLK